MSESGDATSTVSVQNSQQLRTISERYHTDGRGAQRCNRCQQPRKQHSCIFEPVLPAEVEDFLDKKLSDANSITLCAREKYSNDERISNDNAAVNDSKSENERRQDENAPRMDGNNRANKRRKTDE